MFVWFFIKFCMVFTNLYIVLYCPSSVSGGDLSTTDPKGPARPGDRQENSLTTDTMSARACASELQLHGGCLHTYYLYIYIYIYIHIYINIYIYTYRYYQLQLRGGCPHTGAVYPSIVEEVQKIVGEQRMANPIAPEMLVVHPRR